MNEFLKIEASFNGVKILENGDKELSFVISKNKSYGLHYALEQVKKHISKKGNNFTVSIKNLEKKRSLDANAYAWALIGKLSKALKVPKEEVYRNYIKEIGNFEPLPIKNERVQAFAEIWQTKGTGWILEVVDDSKLRGYKLCHAYYGSSVYTTEEMSRLIDMIVADCTEQGIETLTPDELDALKRSW